MPAKKVFKPSDYHAIKLWGQQLGSLDYYIKDQQNRASAHGAPLDALYERMDERGEKKWICVSDLNQGHDFRTAYAVYLARHVKESMIKKEA